MLFRANSFAQISDFTGRILGFKLAPSTMTIPEPPIAVFLGIGFLFLWDVLSERSGDHAFYGRWPVPIRACLYASMIYLLAFGATTQTSAFIYFQF